MKKIIVLVMLFIIGSAQLFAQSNPEGVNYQAVARNSRGEILPNQPISLKVTLFGVRPDNSKVEYYREVHSVSTSITGVFSLIIGKGNAQNGHFAAVPWASENIWMEVGIKSRADGDFTTISNSKLLAVPYAMHAMTAQSLSGQPNISSATSSGSPSQSWLLFGNVGSNPANDKLGTTDSVDLVVVTNNTERMRVFGNGNINIKKNTNMEGTLNVQKSVFLNQTSGSTINYGPFTVDRKSATLLSGTLTVDSSADLNQSLNVDGVTDLNSRLNVNNQSPSFLSGALTVNGITNLNNSLNVNLLSPTLLTGTLRVDKPALFKDTVLMDNTRQSYTPSTGALVVNGGHGIGGNLNVAGESKFGGPVQFAGAVSITDETQSTSTTTGALKISGGVGIGKRLNVGEAVGIGGSLTVAGKTVINETTDATSTSSGSFTTAGGAGIAKNTHIGGTLTVAKATTINNTLDVEATDNLTSGYAANIVNKSGANGINIQVNSDKPSNSNHFITFRNNKGIQVGTVEGEIEGDLVNNLDYQDALIFKSIAVGFASADAIIAGLEALQGGFKVIASATSSTACAGLGICFTAPIPSLIIESGSNLILKIANVVKYAANITIASADLATFIQHKKSQLGVTYESGAGDYAEWLSKKDITETFTAGDIVCMKNGRISKTMEDGGKMMVISHKPIVLGNTPKNGDENNFAKVAFLGQVPVKVIGAVKMGDYILPAGYKGFGIAVSPEKMTIADYKKIVGVSWENANGEPYALVNTAVGLNSNDYAGVIQSQDDKIKKQDSEIAELRKMIEQTQAMITNMSNQSQVMAPVKHSPYQPIEPVTTSTNSGNIKYITPDMHPVIPDQNTVVYSKLTSQQLDDMFAMAEKIFLQSGGKFEDDAFWSKIKKDPAFKQSIRQKISDEFERSIPIFNEANKAH